MSLLVAIALISAAPEQLSLSQLRPVVDRFNAAVRAGLSPPEADMLRPFAAQSEAALKVLVGCKVEKVYKPVMGPYQVSVRWQCRSSTFKQSQWIVAIGFAGNKISTIELVSVGGSRG